ncbi:similar to Saccharomyces cerevisiae YPL232W SSO1 Plasma membrane t-SNARE involved in fusion of secretory vesicles at the plasma membrane and in vesicle fusion during sporulation [Maudiozyma saulgeensis]|uniref:Similar to Saccharomyces cerevisiae YPL232W SSO1 Plasma membrane t-SNARE involved in fusion of secretory vesicles at the plasma membrane and in vesicle fusion during sporulation n=1 Tax=Maudiozyma saulgeensis TaxID=1789683 RepID=A0A1X7R791_9SACH|nr:similar to Saccharomyces cerevisiae YPL232W SSO1 Plasma membrane t-SNARE involved in fusion of secretory vesicles at the plasma membrane and in vesicle fusion during sporulation [Kazachstania saulgeensis]
MSYNNPYEEENPYASESYAMDGNPTNSQLQNNSSMQGDFVQFMNKINEINENLDKYERIINNIDSLHKNLLTQVSEEHEMEIRHQLDNLISQASNLQYQLKTDIKLAQQDGLHDSNKQAQAENSRQRFLKLIQDYRIIDSNYKEENKEQAKRQYKIVQPEATDDEVEAAISDVGGQQIFSQALLNANRRGEAKTALAEVQARHQELLKLEKTMAELTQLFNDMEQLVIEQEENIEVIDKNVENAQQDVEQGVGHTNKAVKSAKRARRNKIRCYAILFLIFAIVVVVVVVPSVVVTRRN